MRKPDALDQIRTGVVGTFVPVVDPPLERWLSGSLKLEPDYIVASLIGDPEAFDEKGLPTDCPALAGSTEAGDILLPGISMRASNYGNLDVARYRSMYLLVDVNLDEVDNDNVSSLQLAYHGLSSWVSNRILVDEPLIEDGNHVGWRAELRYGTATTVPIDEGFSLRFSPGWKVAAEFDRRIISTPLRVTVASDERKPIGDHVVRLDAVHALLSVAHRNPVKAFNGSVKLTPESKWSGFWETNMMAADAEGNATQDFPCLGLEDIGGVEGVAAWVRLVLNNRRSVVPLVTHALFTNQTPEARLLSTASAMETWVAAHRRTHSWAKAIKGKNWPAALIRKVDPAWTEWVGDSEKWLALFWASYTHIKHQPTDDLDPRLVDCLEVSGRWLLAAALLDDCAGNTRASGHLFGKSLAALGRDLRAELDEQA